MTPPFAATVTNDRLIGRGAKDCKLGIASSVMAVKAIQRAGIKLKGNVSLALGADEEAGGQYGVAKMIEAGMIRGDYCIYGEGTPEQIVIGARGFCNMEITVEGKSSHTATKEDGINAIVKMARIIPHLEDMKFTGWKSHPVMQGEPVISVNAITGGLRDNIVPDKCSVILDIRFLPGTTIDDVTANVVRVLEDLKSSDPELKNLKYSIRNVAVGRPVCISPDEPFIGLMSKAVETVTGKKPIPRGSFGSSDSRWIVHDAGIPTINFSMGNDSGHKPNEYVLLEDYVRNVKIYALIMLMYLM